MQPLTTTTVQPAGGADKTPPGAPAKRCKNCNLPLRGPYCYGCGQKDAEPLKSIWTFLKDVVSDVFNFDSKFFRTLWPLFVKPGFLTTQHFAGKRADYVPPLRLYLISSIIFFFTISPNIDKIMDQIPRNKTMAELLEGGFKNAKIITPESQKKTPTIVLPGKGAPAAENQPIKKGIVSGMLPDSATLSEEDKKGIALADSIATQYAGNDSLKKKKTNIRLGFSNDEYGRKMSEKFKKVDAYFLASSFLNHLPTTLIFFIPIWALLMKLLYPLSGHYYMEHLVFNHHVHAFGLLYTSLVIGGLSALQHYGINPDDGWLVLALFVIPSLYLFLAFHNYYKQKWWWLLIKSMFILLGYVYVLVCVIVSAMLLELWVAKV